MFSRKRNGRNPFSDKASLILRAILREAEHLWGVREMAEKTGLNPGYVSRIAEELEKRNYIVRTNNKLRLRSPEGILDDWVRAYNLKKNRLFRFFCMAKSSSDILAELSKIEIPDDFGYALSVQTGASLISPYSVFKEFHVYVRSQKDIEYFKKQLKLSRADQGANLVLIPINGF
ncbi:MAG: helix-turn-helix domain-containing protein [Desulfobacterales bacterium]